MTVIKSPIITRSAPSNAATTVRANLVKPGFDTIIWQKGYDVIKETSLQCPCKGKPNNQQSNCRNCGGSGWLFINPEETRMVMQRMNTGLKYEEWSQKNSADVQITCLAEEEIAIMDRITLLGGSAVFTEVLFLKTRLGTDSSHSASESGSNSDSEFDEDVFYFKTVYPIQKLNYLAIFNGTQNTLVPLKYGVDFIYTENKIILTPSAVDTWVDKTLEEQDISCAARYLHAPQFHIIDIPREIMSSKSKFGNLDTETNASFPVHAVARRSHYVLDEENYDNTRLNSNDHIFSFLDLNPPLETPDDGDSD